MEDRLRECPFCGEKGKSSELWDNHAGCSNSRCVAYYANMPTSEWNTRATDPLLEKMARALEKIKQHLPKGYWWDGEWIEETPSHVARITDEIDGALQAYRDREKADADE